MLVESIGRLWEVGLCSGKEEKFHVGGVNKTLMREIEEEGGVPGNCS